MGENKSLVLPMILKGDNYVLWSSTATTAICSKGYWDHIEPPKKSSKKGQAKEKPEGKEEEDEESSLEEKKWFQEDQVVLGALQSSLEMSILEAYHYCKTPKELWDTLKGVYGDTTNLARIYEIKKALNELKQNDMEFKKYFGKYRSLWSELDMLRPTTTDPKEIMERKEQDKVFGLLLNLNPMYKPLVQHILRGDKLPTLDNVCHQIQRETGSYVLFSKEELPTAHKVEAKKEEEVVANKADYKGRGAPVCQYCKKLGHTKNNCWNLHPHLRPPPNPSNNRFNNQSSNNRNNNFNNSNREHPRANYGETSQGSSGQGEITLKKVRLGGTD